MQHLPKWMLFHAKSGTWHRMKWLDRKRAYLAACGYVNAALQPLDKREEQPGEPAKVCRRCAGYGADREIV